VRATEPNGEDLTMIDGHMTIYVGQGETSKGLMEATREEK
jgi:hypothetical protein